jgi:hypothetical protein
VTSQTLQASQVSLKASQATDSGTHRTVGFVWSVRPSPIPTRAWVRSAPPSPRTSRFETHRRAGAGRWVRSDAATPTPRPKLIGFVRRFSETASNTRRRRSPELGSFGANGIAHDHPRSNSRSTHIVKELPHTIVISHRIVHEFTMKIMEEFGLCPSSLGGRNENRIDTNSALPRSPNPRQELARSLLPPRPPNPRQELARFPLSPPLYPPKPPGGH